MKTNKTAKYALSISALLLLPLLSACNNIIPHHGVLGSSHEQLSVDNKSPTSRLFSKNFSAADYRLFISSTNREITNIHIHSEGLNVPYNEVISIEGQVLNAYMTDLNKDNNNEFIIVFRGSDDSGNVNIMALASNENKSISSMSVNEPAALRAVNTDKVSLIDGQLIRSFISNNELQTYQYKIIPGETAYILRAIKLD